MPGPSLADGLAAWGVTRHVVVPPDLWALLGALKPAQPLPAGGDASGELTVEAGGALPLPGAATLTLAPGDALGFALSTPPDGSFRLDLAPRGPVSLPAALKPARLTPADRLEATGAPTAQVIATPAGGPGIGIRIAGSPAGVATLRLVAPGADDSLTTLALEGADGVLLGESGFGLDLRGGLVIDASSTQAPPPPGAGADPAHYPSSAPAWRGIAVRGARLLLPERTPFAGGAALAVDLDLGSPTGIAGRARAHLPAVSDRPELDATVEWHDPAASSLTAAVPTLVELALKMPAEGATMPDPAGGPAMLELAGGDPIVLRGRYSRDPQGGDLRFDLAVDGVGPQGLVSLAVADQSGAAAEVARFCVTSAALAKAFVAESDTPSGEFADGSGVGLSVVLAAAAGLSSFCEDGSLVVHGVAIEGEAGAAAQELALRVDYSAELQVAEFEAGPIKIGMRDGAPLRVRYRDVRLRIKRGEAGAARFALSFAGARVDVEDPGGWRVEPSGPIGLTVAGTRSGHGSAWFEVDLRLSLDLGPVKVSGATVRGTLTGDPNHPIRAELHGFDVSLAVPGVIEGSGAARFAADRIDASLAARVVPLGVGGFATVSSKRSGALRMVFVELGLDLPGAIPLANSGLGIYGLSGSFGYNAGLPPHDPAKDPIDELIEWRPIGPRLVAEPGMLLGFGLVIGTVPDLGYAFSALGSLAVQTPRLDLRAGIQARFLNERPKFADIKAPTGPPAGLDIVGLLEANPSELLIALRGTFDIPHLLNVTVPVAARFPFTDPAWWLHVGSDGVDGRTPAPVSVTVLPDLLGLGGSGYVMVHGAGITNIGGTGTNLGGFAIGFGLAFHAVLGAFPIVYGDISASVMVGLGSDPLLMLGKAGVAGSLHLGPFSLGLSAELDVQVGPDVNGKTVRWLHVHVCGEIDLFFTSISGCVDIDVGDRDESVPPPDDDPLAGIALTDGAGTQIAVASEGPGPLPEVWPDVMPVIQFSTGPATELVAGAFKEALVDRQMGAESAGDGRYGSADLEYRFFLTGLELERIDEDGVAHPVSGPLAATWQLPRHGNPLASAKLGGARDLALLTRERHSWMRVLNDGGAALPDDPLGVLGRICELRFDAAPGWALGADARDEHTMGVWRLPPEEIPWLARHPSLFSVDVWLTWSESGQLGPLWSNSMPSPFPWGLGGVAPLAEPVEVANRRFSGALTLPSLLGVPFDDDGEAHPDADVAFFGDPPPVARLSFSERLSDPLVVILVHEDLLNHVRVAGEPGGEEWEMGDTADFGKELVAACFAPARAGAEWTGATVAYRPFAAMLVLGVRGLTRQARDSAAAANGALGGSAQEQTDAASTVNPVPSRDMLEPAADYRLTVSQRWEGRRGGGPISGGTWPDRRFHFKTASKHAAGDVLSIARLILMRDWSAFDPAYLERYLAGYTPADQTRDWFLRDPVAAHFRFDHVAELAKRYGHDLAVLVRRTDTPPGAPDDLGQVFSLLLWMQMPALLGAADQRLAALAAEHTGECRIPTAGTSVGGKPLLEPQGTYDLSVRFPSHGERPAAGDRGLPGIVFATSRFGGPDELLGAFGTARDVPVALAGIGGEAVGDAALEAALAALGLGGRAQPREPSASALWAPGAGDWLLAGVLLESPEPLERPGAPPSEADHFPDPRLRLSGVSCPGGAFDASRRNVSSTRVLFLSSNPFAPAGDLTIAARELEPLKPPGTIPGSLSVTCRLSRTPVFAADRVVA